jgi:hypothetical protein
VPIRSTHYHERNRKRVVAANSWESRIRSIAVSNVTAGPRDVDGGNLVTATALLIVKRRRDKETVSRLSTGLENEFP